MWHKCKSLLMPVVAAFIASQPLSTADASTQQVSRMKADFNGDGYEDLAIGAIGEDASGAPDAGAVSVVYGSQNGLTTVGSQYFQQGSAGVADKAEKEDAFGSTVAAGDFNGDGFSDLAVGAPYDDYDENPLMRVSDAGNVVVLSGSASGLTTAGSTLWHQGKKCGGQIQGVPGASDSFGAGLATGDFNGDGFDDLAIGAYQETRDAGNVARAGAVNVIYGSSAGLGCPGNQIWHQGSSGIMDTPEASDDFGWALTAGDFNGDGYEDLAIGVPFENVNGVLYAGAVNIIFGSSAGLSASGNQFWHQGIFGVPGTLESGDQFGYALAAGYFGNDSYEDLAVGVRIESEGPFYGAGAVNVFCGSASGLANTAFISQGLPGVPGDPQNHEYFGRTLGAGDLSGDGLDDLAIGAPFDEDNPMQLWGAGSVMVLYAYSSQGGGGLGTSGSQLWNQASSGILDYPEYGENFGRAVGVGDFDGNGAADLAVGVPYEAYLGATSEGIVHVLYGSLATNGLTATGSQIFWQGILGQSIQPGDYFGSALSSR